MVLPTPARDAKRVADILASPALGFDVVGGSSPGGALIDPTRDAFFEGLEEFKARAKNARVALIYYSGHGIEENSENYLVPVDAVLEKSSQLRSQTIPMSDILKDLRIANAYANIVILDACRDNPFRATRSWAVTKSVFRDEVLAELGEQEVPTGTAILFATGSGRKAADRLEDKSGNSPFTARLLEQICVPHQDALTAFGKVETLVRDDTKSHQIPRTQLIGSIGLFQQIVFTTTAVSPGSIPALAGSTPPATQLPSEPATHSVPIPTSPASDHLAPPNLSGLFTGTYTYGKGYTTPLLGSTVSFRLQIKQKEGARQFTAVIDEPYSGFGVAKDGRLWADVTGEITERNGGIKMHFVKTYRYFKQPSIVYNANFDAQMRQIEGNWIFPSLPLGGSFTLQSPQQQ